jgi:LysR family hydrogen peroxide-inducible transcriptional activator
MNIQQLEYIVALDTYKHFGKAAEVCCVTQPTLSMMIQKLEDEYNLKIFDRSIQPIIPTSFGEKLISQAKQILLEIEKFKEIALDAKNILTGELKVGIIPTIAIYLLPNLLYNFTKKFPEIKLKIEENITDILVEKLKKRELDVAIMSNFSADKNLEETLIYKENFLVYTSDEYDKQYFLPQDIDIEKLWLLEEGHCLRNQIENFCELKQKQNKNE